MTASGLNLWDGDLDAIRHIHQRNGFIEYLMSDNLVVYLCDRKCFFNTTKLADIETHVRDVHHIYGNTSGVITRRASEASLSVDYRQSVVRETQCDEMDCQKTFKTLPALNDHLKYHLCGFGIRSLDHTHECSDFQLSQHWIQLKSKGFRCLECSQFFVNMYDMRRHVHNRHICEHWKRFSGLDDSINSDPNGGTIAMTTKKTMTLKLKT